MKHRSVETTLDGNENWYVYMIWKAGTDEKFNVS